MPDDYQPPAFVTRRGRPWRGGAANRATPPRAR